MDLDTVWVMIKYGMDITWGGYGMDITWVWI